MKKSILALFLIFLMLLSSFPVFAAAAPTFVVESVTAEPGGTIDVPIRVENNPGIACIQLTLTYDPALTLNSVTYNSDIGGMSMPPQHLTSPAKLSWFNGTADTTGDWVFATLSFTVPEDAEGSFPIEITYEADDVYNIAEENISFSVINGGIAVAEAAPTPIDDFSYDTTGTEITITGYNGTAPKVIIGSSYEIEGVIYTVTAIAEEAFMENAVMESISIPDTILSIGDYAFDYCENLTSVILNEGLLTIGAGAFEGCPLTKIVLPKSLVLIDEYGFYDCTELTEIILLGNDVELGEMALGYYFIRKGRDGLVEDLVLEGHEGSTVQSYADSEGISFQPLLRFAGASVSLQNNLAINYKVDAVLVEAYGFSDPYVIVEMNGVQTVLTQYSVSNGKLVFCYRNIAPNQLQDTATATLCATFDGTLQTANPKDYSIADYCYSMLEQYSAGEHAKLQTLLVDLLHYGAASQTYTGYKTDKLVNASLTDAQLQWGTYDDPVLDTVLDTAYKTVENPVAIWQGAGLYLQNSITMRLKFTAGSTDGLEIRIQSNADSWIIPADQFVTQNGMHFVYFNGLTADQLRQKVYLTVYAGDTPVSNTVCYSVESYAYDKQNSTIMGLSDLVKAMMRYSDSAYSYVN